MKEKTKSILLVIFSITIITMILSFFLWMYIITPSDDLNTNNWDETDEYIHNYVDIEINKQHFYVNETTNDNAIITVTNYGDKNISWGDLRLSIGYAYNINSGIGNPDYAKFYQNIGGITYVLYRKGSSRVFEGDLPVLLSGSKHVFNISVLIDDPAGHSGANYWFDYRIGSFSIGVHNLELKVPYLDGYYTNDSRQSENWGRR